MESKVTYQPKTGKETLVWKACDALRNNCEKITYKSIGDWLEDNGFPRGSYSDIGRFLTTWKNKDQASDCSSTSLQNQTNQVLDGAISKVRSKIWAEANNEIEKIQLESLGKLTKAEETIVYCNTQIAKLEQELESANNRIKYLSEELETVCVINSREMVSETLLKTCVTQFEDKIENHIKTHEKTLIELYDHHQQQFDKYLNALQSAKELNYRLEKKLNTQIINSKHEISQYQKDNEILKKMVRKQKINQEKMELA